MNSAVAFRFLMTLIYSVNACIYLDWYGENGRWVVLWVGVSFASIAVGCLAAAVKAVDA